MPSFYYPSESQELLCCFGLGIPVRIAAVVLGFLGKSKAEQGLATNRGQALAGLICGGVAVGLGIVSVVLNLAGAFDYNLPTN